jgi:hypothetical protein
MAAKMFWYGGHWAFWQAGRMSAGTLVFWGLLICGVYALIRFGRRPRQGDQTDEVRRILDERLARGEISPEEHQRILHLITRIRQSRDVAEVIPTRTGLAGEPLSPAGRLRSMRATFLRSAGRRQLGHGRLACRARAVSRQRMGSAVGGCGSGVW